MKTVRKPFPHPPIAGLFKLKSLAARANCAVTSLEIAATARDTRILMPQPSASAKRRVTRSALPQCTASVAGETALLENALFAVLGVSSFAGVVVALW